MDLISQVEALNRIGIALTGETNLQKLMEMILEEARGLTGADGGSLYLKERGHLTFYVTQNKTLNDRRNFSGGFKHHRLPLSKESFAGFVAMTGEILSIEDAYNLPDSAPYRFNFDFDRENDYRTRSVLVVPLTTPDEDVVGILQLINAMDHQGKVISFSESVIPLAKSLASQAAVALRNARLIHDIKGLLRSIIQFSGSAIDARSPHTAGHSHRVAEYSKAIANAINQADSGPFAGRFFTQDQQEELFYSAWLHDIGKIGIPESVLDKQGKVSEAVMASIKSRFELIKTIEAVKELRDRKTDGRSPEGVEPSPPEKIDDLQKKFDFLLRVNTSCFLTDEDMEQLKEIAGLSFLTIDGRKLPYLEEPEFRALKVKRGNLSDEEYKKIQSHVVHTQQIVEKIPFPEFLENVPLFAASHHEMLDGSGYPKGLKAEELPLQSRILAVVDIFDALTAVDRPYRKSMPIDQALVFLRNEAEKGRLDHDVVELFIEQGLHDAVAPDAKMDRFV